MFYFHAFQESFAMGVFLVGNKPTSENIADLMIEVLNGQESL